MACFSLAWLEQLLIWFVIVCFIVAVLRLVIPAVLSMVGAPPPAATVMTVIGWLIGTIIIIYVIIFAFDLIACAMGGSGFGLPALRR